MSIEGISFYDFLGKFVPGLLLLGLFVSPDQFDAGKPFLFMALLIVAYIIGILFDLSVRFILCFTRRNSWMLKRAKAKLATKTNHPQSCDQSQSNDDIQYLYDDAYTCLMIHGTLLNVPLLEAHENFLKNIWIVVILYFIRFMFLTECLGSWGLEGCQLSFLRLTLFLGVLLIPIAWYKVQMQVYRTVWDNDYFTKLILKQNT